MRRFGIILGCGPAGLFAAHAMTLSRWDFRIFSKVARKSEMFGAQYLHEPIPGLSLGQPVPLDYRLRGTVNDYRAKVYGNAHVPFVSPEDLVGTHPAWDIREAYDRAWDRYSGRIEAVGPIDGAKLEDLVLTYRPRRVFSTIPAPALCVKDHGFSVSHIWAIGDAPERGVACPVEVDAMTIECNGSDNPRWYRAANVFGYKTAEWPDGPKPPISGIAAVKKPIRTDCICHTDIRGFHRLGRYGRWEKGYLSHHAFSNAMSVL